MCTSIRSAAEPPGPKDPTIKGPSLRRSSIVLLELVLLTRLAMVWLADHPSYYQSELVHAAGDAQLYASYAHAIGEGDVPYRDIELEYPPAALPFILAPSFGSPTGDAYRIRFAVLMALVDVAGLVGLYRVAQRTGRTYGMWLWALLVPLLGPIAYLRYDIVPAVATIWAWERAQARSWHASGAWVGAGVALKLYPAVLLPATAAICSRPLRFVGTAIAVAGASVAVMGPLATDSIRSVLGYHAGRGIHIESTWGALLLLFRSEATQVVTDHRAYSVVAAATGWMRPASLALSLAAVSLGVIVARRLPRDDAGGMAAVWAATVCLLLAVGTVLSPQYLCWVIALVAVAAGDRAPRLPVLVGTGAATALTQALFPFLYAELLWAELPAVWVLLARNVLLAGVGAALLGTLWRTQPAEPSLS